jgi:3-hydroxyacyl-CoA dehydrogenase / enoyl-CoA hydratase / 3-hydroxybutyryl-CoA epimerase / enoyl-CoA isomerase
MADANAFRFEEIDGRVGLITFDQTDRKVNTLGHSALGELAGLVGRLEVRTDLRGLLFQSGKPGQFIAGADLNELGALAHVPKEQVVRGIELGHALFGRIGRLPFPTVALIDGPCMGGGTELVLAMDERILANGPQTKVALPEVKVGLIPAWGGTQRLPRLIGVSAAVEMITSGEPLTTGKAVALGLAFDAVPAERLVEEGGRVIELLREADEWLRRRERRTQPVGLNADQAAFLFGTAEGMIRARTKGVYPAPFAALRAIREGCNRPLDEGLTSEREAGLGVVGTPISTNLIAFFFNSSRLARDPGVADQSVKPRHVKRVGVLGAGLMGSGVATAHARSGIPTVMVDTDDDRLAAGIARAREVIESRIKIGRASIDDLASMLGLLNTSTSPAVFADCDVVIEAITENETAKTSALRTLAGILEPGAVLASNTSTISITRMAASAPDAARFVGMHFFNPVDRMELVEVVRGEATGDEAVATVVALAKRLRKTPIVVRDGPGFLVNRVLFPYLNEALLLLTEGASADAIDNAAVQFGMPMGPIALEDLVGLDTACYAGQVMVRAFPDRFTPPQILDDLVNAGRLGQKSGAGFRRFSGKGKARTDPSLDAFLARHCSGNHVPAAVEITDRLLLAMLLEATRVLEEKIVREPADVDMGLILGIGFPPFHGGLLRWADSQGATALVDRLAHYGHLGRRFVPTETLARLVRDGGRFYPLPAAVSAFGGVAPALAAVPTPTSNP